MPRLTLILDNGAGELARETITYRSGKDPDEAANLAIHEAIERWTLRPGDKIEIGPEEG